MKLRFFAVPMLDGDEETQELNRFLSTNRVLQVERHFVSDGSRSAWAICVSFTSIAVAVPPRRMNKDKASAWIFGKSCLPEADFAVFVKLRNLRKSMSDKDGLPAYTFFTNEQLAGDGPSIRDPTTSKPRVIFAPCFREHCASSRTDQVRGSDRFSEILRQHHQRSLTPAVLARGRGPRRREFISMCVAFRGTPRWTSEPTSRASGIRF